jgi:paraquat-inducible protein A
LATQSLFARNRKRVDVPALLLAATAGLVVALNLPFMSIDRLIFWQDDYTLFTSLRAMWDSGHRFLAGVIFLFSIIFPFAKLAALTAIWFWPMSDTTRKPALFWLGVLGKWSMLDVFIVALLIVLTQSKGFVDAEAQVGLYVFAGAILLSMLVSILVERVGHRVAAG